MSLNKNPSHAGGDLACDLRIASEKAKLREGFINMGLVLDYGRLYFLPRLVGPAKALELYFMRDVIDAKEAERLGIVNKVVAHRDWTWNQP
ncbi:MAG: hypothetical protein CO012_09265 [Syntrophobacterales bacterium CG_4_8_14_3_um_filter_49_14]|nr:MAG: hypothetical protein COX52_13910 [Syntrophobacterales bacterium CG23_combo_of_CG06-09_8_20_14_all_48_27]PJC73407.1 MAG: hypothetical protein CO012_09265 [Syntrophobacterales bacterium CG_4_8_14_3_um_filter_49_14]